MLLFSKFVLFLCIVSFSSSSNTHRGSEKLFDSVVQALKEATPRLDSLTALNELGPKAAKLFNILIPIGALASETLTPEPQSEEHKILKDLKRQTRPLWNDTDEKIFTTFWALRLNKHLNEYKQKVTDQIRKLNEYSDKLLDPEVDKNESFIKQFKDACRYGDSSPNSILQFMSEHLEWPCENPITPSDAQTISIQRIQLFKIMRRFQVENGDHPDLGLLLPGYQLISEPIKEILLKEPLSSFPNEYESYEEAARHLFEELQVKETVENVNNESRECLMKKVVTMKNFNYHAVQLFGYQIEYQLILLTKGASMCGSILYKNDAKTMKIYKEEFTNHIARIATHASQYLNNSLISAWPYTYNGILQEIMMRRLPNPENVDEYDLKMVAIRTREQLMLTGLPNNVYQILIVRAEGNNYESFFEGTGTNCFFDKQHKGFETMMCRIAFHSSSWEEQCIHVEHRMYNQTFVAEKLNTTIQSEMSQLNLATDLQVIADSLRTKIGKDILDGFSGWAIIRESKHTKCPDIKLWSLPYNVLALKSITALSYTNMGSFTQDCEEFRFFFFM